MGPIVPEWAPGGVDGVVDQVKRLWAFKERHQQVMITSPKQNGTIWYLATWTEKAGRPDGEDPVAEVKNTDLRWLLDRLETIFDGR
jgi:hypothetical protein